MGGSYMLAGQSACYISDIKCYAGCLQ